MGAEWICDECGLRHTGSGGGFRFVSVGGVEVVRRPLCELCFDLLARRWNEKQSKDDVEERHDET